MDTELKVKLSNLKVDNTIEGNVLNDSNGNNITETYLKKLGEEVESFNVYGLSNNKYASLNCGENAPQGKNPFLALYGRDYTASWTQPNTIQGGFCLNAGNLETKSQFIGQANGILKWNNNDLASSAIVAKNFQENGYIKYASGLIIQWGHISYIPKNVTQINMQYNISTNNTYGVMAIQQTGILSSTDTTIFASTQTSSSTFDINMNKPVTSSTGLFWHCISVPKT